MGWSLRGRFKREGTYVYLWLIHIVVWQKPTHCIAFILQLKKKKRRRSWMNTVRSTEKVHASHGYHASMALA